MYDVALQINIRWMSRSAQYIIKKWYIIWCIYLHHWTRTGKFTMYIIKSSSHTVNNNEKAQETKNLKHHSLLPLQTRWDCQMVVHQTVLHLSHRLPDTADGDGTSANCGPPFHTLVDAGQQASSLQPEVAYHSPLGLCAALWYQLKHPLRMLCHLPSVFLTCKRGKDFGLSSVFISERFLTWMLSLWFLRCGECTSGKSRRFRSRRWLGREVHAFLKYKRGWKSANRSRSVD